MYGHADIPGDATEKDRREIAASVDGHGRCAAIRMAKPLVGTALTNLLETEPRQAGDHLTWFEDGDRRHAGSGYDDGLGADELPRHRRSAFLVNQRDDFLQVRVELL